MTSIPQTTSDARADRRTVVTWTVAAGTFGAMFPLFGLLLASHGTIDIGRAHREQSVLYLVDSAPLVLGFVGMLLGRSHSRLANTHRAIERVVRERTSELETALTELRDAHDQLVQAQKLEAIGSLAAGVAHEINTPIQYISDNVRFLQESFDGLACFQAAALALSDGIRAAAPDTALLTAFDDVVDHAELDFLKDEVPSALTQSLDGLQRVAEIVRALKGFAHPGSASKASVDVNKAVNDTLAISRSEWKDIAEVETELDPDVPAVEAISGPLTQALLIVVLNAAQAIGGRAEHLGERRGKIKISTSSDNEWVSISISDNAGGIPAEIRDRIFDPFFTTKDVGVGSGQGLGIAHNAIVTQHGGRITVDVEPNEGTTFTIQLPREPADIATAA